MGLRCRDNFSYGILKRTSVNKILGNLLTKISRVSVKGRAKSSIFRKPVGQRTIIKPFITTTTHSGRRLRRSCLYRGTTLVMSPVRPAYITVTSRERMSHIRCAGGSRTHNRKSLARASLYGRVSTEDCCNCGIGNRSQLGTQLCVSCWRRSEEFRDQRTVATFYFLTCTTKKDCEVDLLPPSGNLAGENVPSLPRNNRRLNQVTQ